MSKERLLSNKHKINVVNAKCKILVLNTRTNKINKKLHIK